MKSREKEKKFQRYFHQAIKHLGGRIYKIPDVGNSKKPFDGFISYKGKIKAIELKRAPTYKTNVYRLLKDHQISNLVANYPNAYIVCYYKKEKATSVFQIQKDTSLKEVVHLKKLLEVCDYLLGINSKHS